MLELKAFLRNLKEKAKQRRRLGFVPAIIYGHNIKNLAVEVLLKEFQKIYQEAGESTLLTLKIENETPRRVLIHDVCFHPTTDNIEHVDFYQVRSDEKISLEIELRFIGAPPAVHEKGGILVTPLNKLKIECLPGDLTHEFEVDLSVLKDIREMIRVKDLKVPAKIRVLNNPDDVVAVVEAPRVEEEVKKPEEQPVVAAEGQPPAVKPGEEQAEQKGTEKLSPEKAGK